MFKKIPRTVFILGLVSFFNDLASEMIYPIVPIFLTTTLGAPVMVVGLIEGIAEATASLMKFVAGYISDLVRKRKIFVVAGYSLGAISKLLIALALTWQFVLFARIIDRFGKGIRTSARDSILLQNTNGKNRGLIFGFHRAFDSFGAVVGPILGLILIYLLKENIRLVFFLAFIPAIIAVLLLFVFVREKYSNNQFDAGLYIKRFRNISISKVMIHILSNFRSLNTTLRLFLVISFIFALGNSSDAFLILRARQLGLATGLTIATYILFNLSQTVFATPAGKLADIIGAKRVYAAGLLVFSLVYFLFGIIHNPNWIWIIFPVYGIYIAATDGVSKAYISQFITEEQSGTYFGFYQMGIAVCGFFASFIGGILWSKISPSMTFLYGSIMALLAFSILLYGKAVKRI